MPLQPAGHRFDVVRMVLAIGVASDHSNQVRPGAQRVVEGGLERRALAQVHRVPQQLDLGELRRTLENLPKIGAAAIVHNHDRGQRFLRENLDQIDEPRGWPIRRYDHREAGGLVRNHVWRLRLLQLQHIKIQSSNATACRFGISESALSACLRTEKGDRSAGIRPQPRVRPRRRSTRASW